MYLVSLKLIAIRASGGMADAMDSKSIDRKVMRVRLPPRPPIIPKFLYERRRQMNRLKRLLGKICFIVIAFFISLFNYIGILFVYGLIALLFFLAFLWVIS